MLLPLGALLDPFLEERDLSIAELLTELLGRHAFVLFRVGDPLDELAVIRFARLDGPIAAAVGLRFLFHIQPEIRLAGVLVRPVAGVAVVGEDRANVAVVLDDGG